MSYLENFLFAIILSKNMPESSDDYDEHLKRVYKWNVAGLVLSWVIWSPFQSMARPYFQLYAKELGATPMILAIISFVSTITLGFTRIVGGYVADKHGRKKIVVYMTTLVSMSYLLYAMAPDWTWLVAGSFLLSVALLYQPALWSLMSDSAPKESRGKIFSIYNFIPGIISSVSPFLAIYFVQQYTLVPALRLIYILTFVCGMVAAGVRAIFLKETLITSEKRTAEFSFWESYKTVLSFIRKNFMYILLIDAIVNVAISMGFLVAYYSVYFLGLSEVDWGFVWIITAMLGLIVTLPSGALIDKIGRKPIILLSTILYLFGDLILFMSPYLQWNIFIVVTIATGLTTCAASIYFIVINSIVTDVIPLDYRGRANSILGLIINIVGSVATLIAGAVYTILGANVPFLIGAILIFITVIIISIKLKETK